jgi:hypothetical protein
MVRYADDLVLLAKEKTLLQSKIDKLIEVGRGYGMEINVEKSKTMRILRQPSPLQIKADKKPVENVEEFNYLGSMITNYSRCTQEIKARIAIGKAAFSRKKTLFTSKLDLRAKVEISEVLHLEHSFVWRGDLDASETRSEVPGRF